MVSIILISGIATISYLISNQKQTVETANSSSSSQDQSSSQENSQNSQASSKSESSNSPESSSSSSSSNSRALELKTYSNQYYPSLKIVYDETWKFETKTEKTLYTNVVDRLVTLEKNGTKLSFFITPKFIGGCGPYENPNVNKPQNLNLKDGKIDRYQLTARPQSQFYEKKGLSENIDDNCALSPLILNSNLVSDEYTRFFPDEKFIVSMVRINIQGNDPRAISEADKIVEQSTFFDVSL